MTNLPKPVETLKTALSNPPTQETSVEAMIKRQGPELEKLGIKSDRLIRIALTAMRLNPDLAACTPQSLLGALFTLASVGLEPVNGTAYILPFNNRTKVGNDWKTVKTAQCLIGYKGLLQLFYRSDSALSLDVQTVFENDRFSYEHGTDAFLKHQPASTNRGNAIGFYAIARMRGGASLFRYMSAQETLEHGKNHSKTYDSKAQKFYDSSPWATDFEAMSKKTVVIQLAKLLPLSFELQRAISVDETSRDYRQGIDSAFDLPVSTTWKKEDEPIAGEVVQPKPNEFEQFNPQELK